MPHWVFSKTMCSSSPDVTQVVQGSSLKKKKKKSSIYGGEVVASLLQGDLNWPGLFYNFIKVFSLQDDKAKQCQ